MGPSQTFRGATLGRAGKGKAVFISAPTFVNSLSIRRILEEEGVKTVAADEKGFGRTLPVAVAEGVRAADMAIGIVDGSPGSSNVFFEIGMAQGMKKPTLFILAPNVVTPDLALSGVPYLRANLDDVESLRFGLRQFLNAPHHGNFPAEVAERETHPIGKRADALLTRLKTEENLNEAGLIEIVREALQASGVQTQATRSEENARAEIDIAVWSRDLEPWVGNPLVIEIKTHLRTQANVDAVVGMMTRYIAAVNGRWALLLYLTATQAVRDMLNRSYVLSMSIEDLLRKLKTVSFGEVVVELRNRAAHGVR